MDKLYKDLVSQVNRDKKGNKKLNHNKSIAEDSEEIDEDDTEEENDLVDPSNMHKDGNIKYMVGQTSSFNATGRFNKALQTKHYGDGSSVGPIFFPNHS